MQTTHGERDSWKNPRYGSHVLYSLRFHSLSLRFLQSHLVDRWIRIRVSYMVLCSRKKDVRWPIHGWGRVWRTPKVNCNFQFTKTHSSLRLATKLLGMRQCRGTRYSCQWNRPENCQSQGKVLEGSITSTAVTLCQTDSS